MKQHYFTAINKIVALFLSIMTNELRRPSEDICGWRQDAKPKLRLSTKTSMTDLFQPDLGVTFYRSRDPIKNFKIRYDHYREQNACI